MKMTSRNSAITTLSRGMLAALLLSFVFMVPNAFAAGEKTGVVDVAKVIQQMPETKKAENILKSTSTQWKGSLDKLKQDFESAAASYEKQKAGLSKAAREQKAKELELKLKNAQKFQMDKFGPGGALDKKKAELFAPIRAKMLAAVKSVADKEGFTLIIDKQAMVYGGSAVDITAKVIAQLK